MFPISCNAFGDIVAAAELVRAIVVALDDSRGAAKEYQLFVHVLTGLGTAMGEAYELAKVSRNDALRQAVLEEVQLCCISINNAHKSIAGFEKLVQTSDQSSPGKRAGIIFAKLHWRFLRTSDVVEYTKRFSESHHRLNTYISLLTQ